MSFDPETFLNQSFDLAQPLDTKLPPCPVGEYLAASDKVEIKTWASKDGSSSGLKCVIMWEIQDENVKKLLERNPVRVKQEQMLDVLESGALDLSKGKNIGLGRILEALDLNKPGKGAFAFSMLAGRMAKVRVSHRASGEDIYDEIKAITKA